MKNLQSSRKSTEYRERYRTTNRDRIRESQKRHYRRTRARELRVFLAAQNGECALCGIQVKAPVIDHDHNTGRRRGALCRQCNLAVGGIEYFVGRRMLHFVLQYIGVR